MSVILSSIGLAGIIVGLVALAKGSLQAINLASRKQAGLLLLGAGSVLFAGVSLAGPADRTPSEDSSPAPELTPSAPSPSPSPTRPAGLPPEAQEATVASHIDGDSIWAEGGTLPAGAQREVRLLEIDSPDAPSCYSGEASDFTANELPIGSRVYLMADKKDTDSYGRFLRYLWKADGEFFNEKLARQGYAKSVLNAPNDRFISQIRAAEAAAKAEKLGLWGACATGRPGSRSTSPSPQQTTKPRVPGCEPSVPDFCVARYPPDLDCPAVGRNDFRVLEPDPHGFDGNNDGIGCESPPGPEDRVATPQSPTAQSCDPSVPGFCVPRYPPDLDCPAVGRTDFQVLEPDPHGFDADNDGIGCESSAAPPQQETPQSPASGQTCSSSYPDFCIPPPPPDLDCGQVGGTNFTVEPPDPHGFDGDNDGVGCET